jgi:phage baseplate assembly protein W
LKDEHLLTDLQLELRNAALRPVYGAATQQRRVRTSAGTHTEVDVRTVSGADNLAQAVLIRLLTPVGELEALGHPEYGSRLHSLVGRTNTETTRNLAKLYILSSLALEPRIAEVVELTVEPSAYDRSRVDVLLRVKPVGATPTVTIGPFSLEFAS